MLRFAVFVVLLMCFFKSEAQVEIFRADPSDTAKYIAPEDTITRAPMFGGDPDDFYRYIENRYNLTLYGQYLSYYPNNIQFSFYVECNGSISDFKIIYASQLLAAKEIEHVVSRMPAWTPGKQDGRKKRTLMVYDINIQLTSDIPAVLVTKNAIHTEFSNKHKSLKWFMVAGSVIIMITLLLTRN